MATKYTLTVRGSEPKSYARKDAAVKAGEKTSHPFTVKTDNGTVVHNGAGRVVSINKPPAKKAAAKKTAPKPPVHDEDDEIAEEEEKPMTKSEAYAWFKRSREGLRDAERAIERGDGKSADLVESLNDAQGAIAVLLQALGNLGINGVA